MLSRAGTLQKSIQEVQKFIGDRLSQNPSYKSVEQLLEELDETLKIGKLKLNIVSQDLAQAETLQRLLVLNGQMQGIYQIKAFPLPQFSNLKSPSPTLMLQSTEVQPPTSYALKNSDSQVIGRNPAEAQILLPDRFGLVSGTHAELRCMNNEWQIRDLGSRNGTFIDDNPQKLQDWYTLKRGDCIRLGSASQGSGSAALIFETPSQAHSDLAQVEAQRILNCNVLCIVISAQPLGEEIQQLFQIKGNPTTKLFFIVDRPGDTPAETFKETISRVGIEDSIRNQLQDTSFEVISLLLKPFTPTSNATIITPHGQPEFEYFYQNLKAFSEEKAETILQEWGTVQLSQLINQIESSLTQQDKALKENLQKAEAKFKELSQGSFKKQADKAYRKVDGERDSFFRQVKTELGQSKANLLDEHRQSSISYRIQQFAKQLHPQVSDQGGYRYIRLEVTTGNTGENSNHNVHAAATELCHNELTRWATTEWNRIQSEYCDGGIEALLERSYKSLSFIPDLNIPKDEFSLSQTLSIESILNISNVEPTLELRYKQASFWGYVSKTLRTNMMTILGMVTMLGGGLIAFDKAMLIPPLVPIVFVAALLSYKHEKEAKIEEISGKLQKEVTTYYLSYTKGLLDRLAQRIGALLEVEERRFRETLETVKEFYALYQADLDRMQNDLKSNLSEMKSSGQNKIDKDLKELQKIKQMLL